MNALRSPQPATQPATSPGLDETPALIARQTKYSTFMIPSQRKAEVVKRKLGNELVASSLDSSEEENGRHEEKKRKIDHTKEAQLAHQKMCQKAMDTMHEQCERLAHQSEYLFRQDQKIRKKKKSHVVTPYLIGLFRVCLTHFDH